MRKSILLEVDPHVSLNVIFFRAWWWHVGDMLENIVSL